MLRRENTSSEDMRPHSPGPHPPYAAEGGTTTMSTESTTVAETEPCPGCVGKCKRPACMIAQLASIKQKGANRRNMIRVLVGSVTACLITMFTSYMGCSNTTPLNSGNG